VGYRKMRTKPFFMRNLAIITAAASMLLASCGGGDNNGDRRNGHAEAKGGRVYGGCVRIAESEPYQSLYPMSIVVATSSMLTTKINEGLVTFNISQLKFELSLPEK